MPLEHRVSLTGLVDDGNSGKLTKMLTTAKQIVLSEQEFTELSAELKLSRASMKAKIPNPR